MPEQDPSTAADLEQALLDDATEGIQSVSIDGQSVSAIDLDKRLKVLERQNNAAAASLDGFGMRHRQLRSGAGGFP